ncbi:cyclase family protein [Fundidesulfovibrio butyratiphilus]
MPAPWIDISRPVFSGMSVWPGDPPTTLDRFLDQARGDPCTVTALGMSAHSGAHVEAPLHSLVAGANMDSWPFETGIGRARVVALEHVEAITERELRPLRPRRGERLLFKTANSAAPVPRRAFTPAYVALTPDAARFLARRQVRLVGMDGPSVGPFDEPEAAVHRALLQAGVWVLENLDLSAAPPGPVELVCLPLRLAGAEAAPARAVLRPLAPRLRRG